MSSTYSSTLRIQLIDTNTEFEAWGQPTDNNLGTIIEQAIVGSNTISLTNLTTYTLSTANAAPDEARNAVLVFNGVLTANCNVIAPSVQKVYVISNQTTGGYGVTIKTSGGNGVQVANGTNQLVYCNGTVFSSAVNVNTIIGNLSVSGSSTVGGNVSVGTTVTLGSAITGTSGNLALKSNGSVVNFQRNSGALIPPSGSVAQRPPTPALGMSRWNTDYGYYEIWNGTIWQQITGSFNANYLVVAGGGGGGTVSGGGGGGITSGFYRLTPSTAYTITVGSGGTTYTSGANSSAFGATAIGGGYGGSSAPGGNGGSGGGGGVIFDSASGYPGGSATSGQGYAGGTGGIGGNSGYNAVAGSGGGGAGSVGGNGTTTNDPGTVFAGNGGSGFAYSITGTSTYYAGGGGGGSNNGVNGSGGAGGGGNGYISGTANTGGGAGALANGGSGVVIISYQSSYVRATGGTITTYTSGGSTQYVHKFTSSGTFTII